MESRAWILEFIIPFGFNPNCAAMGINNTLSNGQAEAWPSTFKFRLTTGMQLRVTQPAKFLKNPGLVFQCDADTSISDDHLNETGQQPAVNMDASTIGGIFYRIKKNIPKRLVQALTICKDHFVATRKL